MALQYSAISAGATFCGDNSRPIRFQQCSPSVGGQMRSLHLGCAAARQKGVHRKNPRRKGPMVANVSDRECSAIPGVCRRADTFAGATERKRAISAHWAEASLHAAFRSSFSHSGCETAERSNPQRLSMARLRTNSPKLAERKLLLGKPIDYIKERPESRISSPRIIRLPREHRDP